MYSYPTRPGGVGPPPPSAFVQPPPQMAPHQGPPIYVPPPPSIAAIGPGLYSMPSGSVTTLRLKLAEDVRIDQPIAVSAALLPSSNPQAITSPDLSLERQLVEGEARAESGPEDTSSSTAGGGAGAGGAGGGRSKDDVKAFLGGIKAGEMPQDPAIKKVAASGMQPAPAALGVIYARPGRGGPEKAADFASKCEQLTGMGFSLALAAGALAKHKGDVEAATESCLALASS